MKKDTSLAFSSMSTGIFKSSSAYIFTESLKKMSIVKNEMIPMAATSAIVIVLFKYVIELVII